MNRLSCAIFASCAAACAGSAGPAPLAPPTSESAEPAPRVRGYDGTEFVADPQARAIHRVRDGVTEVFASDIAVTGPLALNGGRLVFGAADGVYTLALSSGETTRIAATPAVVGLAIDHVGYYVVRTGDPAKLVRVTPGGEVAELSVAIAGTGPIRFDAAARVLHVDGAAHDYLALVGEDAAVWAQRDARPMQPFEVNGVVLSGGEYWPNRGDQPTRYPEDVLWGFYPEQGVVFEGEASAATPTAAALACAHTAHERLRTWAQSAPPAFFEAAKRVGSNRFYLWTNDYSEAVDPFPQPMRMNQFWFWQRKPAVPGRVPGYWKWESTVTQSGQCLTPEPAQIDAYLADKLAE